MSFIRTVPAVLHLLVVVLIALATGCAAPQIGGPAAPRGDAAAGLLTLPSGRTVPVYPAELAYTGVALYRWPDGREYDGTWVDGRPDGMGVEQLADGETYRGQFQAGLRDGHGALVRPDGSRYVGDFANGLRDGRGAESTDNGLYRGGWADDLPNGAGDFFDNDGATYHGQWLDGERDGQGVYDDGRGNRYEGDWAADRPNGFGRMESAEGTLYVGALEDNLRDGYGRLEAGGFVYEGTWSQGRRQGYGRVETPDGNGYVGGWRDDQRHGRGRATYADGSYYDGGWRDDKPYGPGTRVDASGIEITGTWDDDLVQDGTVHLPGGARYSGPLMRPGPIADERFVAWLQTQAAARDPHAELLLGTIFSDYVEPAPDPARARTLFLAAADAGVPRAQYRAGLACLDSDPDAAVRLLAAAAAAGQADASALLGEYYATGTYVPRDTSVAITYFTQASDGGNLSARNNLAWILSTYPDSMIRDGARAVALIEPLAVLYDNWRHLDTLAAAYAETGRYEQAATTQARALALATSEAAARPDFDRRELEHMQERLELYNEGQSFRESGGTSL